MSKAFTKDDAPDAPLLVPERAPLPDGVPNYVTRRGLALLQEEQAQLRAQRASIEAEPGEEVEHASRLDALARRIAGVEARINSARMVDAREPSADEVRFGATVSVRLAGGDERRYRIVGVDEADAAQGRVSFLAPIARVMLGHAIGDIVSLPTAHGEESLEIIDIEYDS